MRVRAAIDTDQPPPRHLSRQAVRQLVEWLRPHAGTIAANVALSVALTAVELATPFLLERTIDSVAAALGAVAGAAEAAAAAVRGDAWRVVGFNILGFACLFLGAEVIRHFEIRRTVAFAQRFMYRMRGTFFRHLHALSPSFYDRWKAGQVIARGTTDMDAVQEAVTWAPNHIVASVLKLTGAVAVLAIMDGWMFLAVFPLLPLLFLLTRWFRGRAIVQWRQVRVQTGRLTATVAESIAGARVIQAFAREQQTMADFADLTGELYTTRVEAQRVHARYQFGMRMLGMVAGAVVMVVGAWRVSAGEMQVGQVAASLVLVQMFFQPMDVLSHMYNQLLHATAALDRVMEVLDARPDIVDRPGAADPDDFRGAVTFEGVTFAYDPGVTVLDDVSFRVEPGEVIALVGPTGAGKTTLCRLVARFYEPQRGTVRIDGRPVGDVTQASLHRRLAIVQQENFLFAGTVMDNIRYGRPEATDAEVIACARRIGSHRAVQALPRGYQTEVGERGQSLSVGQRQLICFTRAMLADPRILILDEATSSVDTQAELEVQEALRRLTERRTCFIVAHRLSTVRRADRVFVIEHGRIIETGTHADLVAAGGRYARMYEEFIRAE